jgi:hypothetical protein
MLYRRNGCEMVLHSNVLDPPICRYLRQTLSSHKTAYMRHAHAILWPRLYLRMFGTAASPNRCSPRIRSIRQLDVLVCQICFCRYVQWCQQDFKCVKIAAKQATAHRPKLALFGGLSSGCLPDALPNHILKTSLSDGPESGGHIVAALL